MILKYNLIILESNLKEIFEELVVEYLLKNRLEKGLKFFKSKMKNQNFKSMGHLEDQKFENFQVKKYFNNKNKGFLKSSDVFTILFYIINIFFS